MLEALGYDAADPYEVQPEYAADFRADRADRVDFAIMRDGRPIIAIECKKVGADLASNRGQLRAYFSALQSVRLAILTNGLQFEFFVDCDEPNVMDEEPFLSIDMTCIAGGRLLGEQLDALGSISNPRFDPSTIADLASIKLVQRRLKAALVEEVREPSEEFCRLILQKVGLRNLRRNSIRERYQSLVQVAYQEAIVRPVLDQLKALRSLPDASPAAHDVGDARIVTTDRELAVYRYVCRRLAFLVSDEHHFAAIEQVQHRDYIGKFVVFYQNVRKGRIFDFIEGGNGYDKFVFPAPIGEIVTNNISEIDEPLRNVFSARVRELGSGQPSELRRPMALKAGDHTLSVGIAPVRCIVSSSRT
ncbi:type I restriction enzyme HsdR N-terminal domain-containing protein [Leptospira interrogans]